MAAALASHLATGAAPTLGITALLAGGTAAGRSSAPRSPSGCRQRAVGRSFAVVVTLVALFLAIDTLVLGGPPGS